VPCGLWFFHDGRAVRRVSSRSQRQAAFRSRDGSARWCDTGPVARGGCSRSAVIEGDRLIDELTSDVEQTVWDQIDTGSPSADELRRLIGILLILPELERSADLAKHIAQRAVFNLGAEMSPLSRGIVQRMTEVALEMWKAAADAFGAQISPVINLDEDDEEIDILHERLTGEVARGAMRPRLPRRSRFSPVSTSVWVTMP